MHSAKDVPGELPDGLAIAAVPAGEDPRDALCRRASSIDALPEGARVGTSSLRRRSQLLAIRPDLEVVPLRGNVDTRLRKLAEGEYDAIVLALAGLRRLGRDGEAGAVARRRRASCPRPARALLALETRAGDDRGARARALDDAGSRARLEAERAVVEALDASCHTPVGAHARVDGDADRGARVRRAARRQRVDHATGSRARADDPRCGGRGAARGACSRRAPAELLDAGPETYARTMRPARMSDGIVYLVGAGPGDPGLATVRALDLIGRADVILYDRLVPPRAARARARPTRSSSTSARSPGDPGSPRRRSTACWSSTRARAGASCA